MKAARRAPRSKWRGFIEVSSPGRFRLLRYFTLTSLVAVALVGTALLVLEREESTFVRAVQRDQSAYFTAAQAELVRKQDESARANLLSEHETSHVTLGGILSNALWNAHFAGLVERASKIAFDRCRVAPRDAKRACEGEIGRQIMALPGFSAADAAVRAMMHKSAVFKIKVYDLRGLTVYSSELAQVGEDKSANQGWISAVRGKAASELVHRDRFSAFEGEVENRDLIQTYLAAYAPGGERITGVFEIYSDVTGLLRKAGDFSARLRADAAENDARVAAASAANQRKVDVNSNEHVLIFGGLLLGLWLALLVLVRHAQGVIDEQTRDRERAALREQQAHRDKMAALATMAAEASHEIRNPLAVIAGLAEQIAEAPPPAAENARAILEQTSRIAELTQRITEFASTRGEAPAPVDVNRMVAQVCDFLGFDERYRGLRVETALAPELPACRAIPDHLHEVLMNTLEAFAETARGASPRLRVATRARTPNEAVIRIALDSTAVPDAADPRIESAQQRTQSMGGRLVVSGAAIEIVLPTVTPGTDPL